MERAIKTFEPEERRWLENNLYCGYCGNTNQFKIDLRLRQKVECHEGGLSIQLDKHQTEKVFHAIESNLMQMVDRSLDYNKTIFKCANCDNSEVDIQERVLETCLWMACPGCFHCGNWIDRDELIEYCSECVEEKSGDIVDDDCFSLCPYYDFGLEMVRHHYGIDLNDIKRDLGYEVLT